MLHTSHHIWQERLYARLFQQPYPLFVFDDGVIPAASMWFLVREWVHIFRNAGLCAGDRIVIALPPTRTFVAVLLAGLWERCTIALCPPSLNASEAASFLDAKAIIREHEQSVELLQTSLQGHSKYPANPDIRLLLASSGTTSAPRWFALSDTNIVSVIDSHTPFLGLMNSKQAASLVDFPASRVLSVLPLHHAFGLIIDFLPALFAGAEIVRVADYGRNLDALMQTAEVHGITHCSMVPLLAQRLAQSERGRSFLCGLQGGVIGGAPVRAELVPLLRQTRLRVGYGQTEASPGITLGEAGIWTANYLGKILANPLGCEVRINADSVLEFRGANACMGAWTADGFVPFPPDRWHATGDIVQTSNDAALEGYVFVGRADDNFKLSNGRFIPAVHWEHLLKHRIESCVEAMITTLDGEHCTIALLHDNHSSEDALRLIISDVLNIQPYVMATIHNLTREEWCFTPKGSTDRQAMKRLLETLSNPHR